jgi:hypothetical protein
LFAAKVVFRCLHRNVFERKLNLLQIFVILVAQPGADPSWIVRGWRRDSAALCYLLHNAPNHLGVEAGSQTLPVLLVERRSMPVEILEAPIQTSMSAFTKSGTGIVRM